MTNENLEKIYHQRDLTVLTEDAAKLYAAFEATQLVLENQLRLLGEYGILETVNWADYAKFVQDCPRCPHTIHIGNEVANVKMRHGGVYVHRNCVIGGMTDEHFNGARKTRHT